MVISGEKVVRNKENREKKAVTFQGTGGVK